MGVRGGRCRPYTRGRRRRHRRHHHRHHRHRQRHRHRHHRHRHRHRHRPLVRGPPVRGAVARSRSINAAGASAPPTPPAAEHLGRLKYRRRGRHVDRGPPRQQRAADASRPQVPTRRRRHFPIRRQPQRRRRAARHAPQAPPVAAVGHRPLRGGDWPREARATQPGRRRRHGDAAELGGREEPPKGERPERRGGGINR
ncbi:hypothetical protein BU14_0111s0018 [Porphyra umbilicalis]|uniref:Uncharacterized protein n=1 Tax=Porphyra umbilicalis TaxID=2786 RepID=A0A1X6PBP9_PORUM|nr:hypothetical protein BU14_0111s0018 [Porphyra umbilicalis]|eukprot:OSX78349.1 hypothetical protein BU14_0111s0018 [Porphyra umbilicalis]